MSLGRYPTVSLADARRRARQVLGEVASDGDPAQARQDARHAPTLEALAALYLEKHARVRKRSWRQDRRMIENELLPKWRGLRAGEIRRRDVRELVEAIAERPAPISANRVRALISKIFNFGVSREVVEFNPCAQLEQPGRERRRDRVLTDAEIRLFWTALDQEPAEIAAAFRLRQGHGPARRGGAQHALGPLGGDAGQVVRDVPGSGGLQLHVVERPIGAMGTDGAELPAGTRSASCFLVNRRTPDEAQPDCAYAFQAEIEVRADEGFVPRPDLRGARAEEWDDQVADLHYADTPEYATGHGVSAEWDLAGDRCRSIRTAWIGAAEVEKTQAADVLGVELSISLGRGGSVTPFSPRGACRTAWATSSTRGGGSSTIIKGPGSNCSTSATS